MSELSGMPNVGKVLEQNLIQAGIDTPEQLRKLGAKQAFLRIRAAVDPGACVHMLYGLEGAVRGMRDALLPEDAKADLRAFFRSL